MILQNLSKVSFILILFFLCSIGLSANDMLDRAASLEREGSVNQAIDLYSEWLRNNRDDERFYEILIHNASIEQDLKKSISILLDHVNFVSKDKAQEVYVQIADLYYLSFRLSEAADYYRIAANINGEKPDPELFLKYLKLKYQTGEIPSEGEIDSILLNDISTGIFVDALIFKSEILKYKGDFSDAVNLIIRNPLSSVYPEMQLAMWEIYGLMEKRAEQKKIQDFMMSNFPQSIELAQMEGRISKVIRLSDLMLTNDEISFENTVTTINSNKTYIQVGVFRNTDNAEALSNELKSEGFKSFISSERNANRVIVVDEKPADELLPLLRSKGFAGFRIDYQADPD